MFLILFSFLCSIILTLIQIGGQKQGVVALFENNLLGNIFMFLAPVILSILLFSFVFQRKKVDFMMGMPISRKQIFLTNTITGIIITLCTFLIHALLLWLFSSFGGIVLSFSYLVHYLIYSILGYILVFTISNMAISLAGNMLTSFVLIALFIFLVPTTTYLCQYYVTDSYRSVEINDATLHIKNYENCKSYTERKDCEKKALQNTYYVNLEKRLPYTSTIPFQTLINTVRYIKEYPIQSYWKTLFLIPISIILGCIFFQRRKMEECEISFQSIHIHHFVKSLTIFPFLLFLFLIDLSFQSLWIAILIFFSYYILYDLVTRKKMTKFSTLFFYFMGTLSFCFLVSQGIKWSISIRKLEDSNYVQDKLDLSDIKGFRVYITPSSDIGLLTGSHSEDIIYQNKETLKSLLEYAIDTSSTKERNEQYQLILKDGSTYNGTVSFTTEERKAFIKQLQNEKAFSKYRTYSKQDILTVGLDGIYYPVTSLKNGVSTVEKILKSSNHYKNFELTTLYGNYLTITLYHYRQLETLNVSLKESQELTNELIQKNNEKIKEILSTKKIIVAGLSDNYLQEKSALNTFTDFLNKSASQVDSTKKYFKIYISFEGDSRVYYYYTNELTIEDLFDIDKTK